MKPDFPFIALLLAFPSAQAAQDLLPAYTIDTLTGSVDIGDGGTVSRASLSGPVAIAFDAAGDLYIGDQQGYRIRRVSSNSNLISTTAGAGILGFGGDGGPANEALLAQPNALAFDATGNLHFSDGYNYRIRRISADGTISSIAGTGKPGFSGDGGPARLADINKATGLAFDTFGNLYFSTVSRIRRITPDGVITTVAGTGDSGFNGDGGAAVTAQFKYASGLATGPDGSLYIADSGNHRIRKLAPDGTISTFAGNGDQSESGDGGLATEAGMPSPSALGFDADGNLYVISQEQIRKIDPDGIISSVFPESNWWLGGATLAVDPSGSLHFSAGSSIWRVSASAKIDLVTFGFGQTRLERFQQ